MTKAKERDLFIAKMKACSPSTIIRFYSGPQTPNNHIFVMAEYYSEIVFPDPFESFFTYVCYYLAVHISNLPLGNLKSFSFPLAMNVNNREKFARNVFKNAYALAHLICDCLKSSHVILEEAMEEASKEGCVLPKADLKNKYFLLLFYITWEINFPTLVGVAGGVLGFWIVATWYSRVKPRDLTLEPTDRVVALPNPGQAFLLLGPCGMVKSILYRNRRHVGGLERLVDESHSVVLS
ncbi:hypothetical protein F2Q69_00040547 [Brassica cretica]|uniref:Uncharacterized protein n=1 Tax=Brassica cretica TaxID=69181 RepID=A0A8S9NPX2_BRACR|nr:hypothetical protein F2Q69_00040547 [Brassica cretica]